MGTSLAHVHLKIPTVKIKYFVLTPVNCPGGRKVKNYNIVCFKNILVSLPSVYKYYEPILNT
jgi:hypothetical protein